MGGRPAAAASRCRFEDGGTALVSGRYRDCDGADGHQVEDFPLGEHLVDNAHSPAQPCRSLTYKVEVTFLGEPGRRPVRPMTDEDNEEQLRPSGRCFRERRDHFERPVCARRASDAQHYDSASRYSKSLTHRMVVIPRARVQEVIGNSPGKDPHLLSGHAVSVCGFMCDFV